MALDLEARETSFDLITPREELIDTFYARLFAAAPDGQDAVRLDRPALPEGDAARHARAAAQVAARPRRDHAQAARDGARHVAYGAEPDHYPVVGQVLIASMAEIADDAWRPEHGRAWAAAFDVVAGAMLAGAAASRPALAA